MPVLNIDQEHVDIIMKKYPERSSSSSQRNLQRTRCRCCRHWFATQLISKASFAGGSGLRHHKAVYDNPKKLAKGYADFIKMTPAFGLEDMVIPLHAGSAKILSGKGLKVRPEIQPTK